MKKVFKTETVLGMYNILKSAKYANLNDDDKVKVWKIARTLKPIADKFDDDRKDAIETMKPGDDFDERLKKAQEYETKIRESKDASELPIGPAQYDEFVNDFKKYNELIGKAVKEFADKEVEVEIASISDECLGKLMSSNDWTMEQVLLLDPIVGGEE